MTPDMEWERAYDFWAYYEEKVRESVDCIKKFLSTQPLFGIVFGSGWGSIADLIQVERSIDYGDIPHFTPTSVPGHAGKILIGNLQSIPVVAFSGRVHYYEVADQPFSTGILRVVYPVNVLASLGIPNYFTTNAVGGLNPNYQVGDLVVVKSHLNFLPNPLVWRQKGFKTWDGRSIPRFVAMNDAYDLNFRKFFLEAGKKSAKDDHLHEGILISLPGPSYETEAECVGFRDGFHADVVGMSVTPEVIMARSRGLRVLACSCVTNLIAKEDRTGPTHEEVVSVLATGEFQERIKKNLSYDERGMCPVLPEKTQVLLEPTSDNKGVPIVALPHHKLRKKCQKFLYKIQRGD